MRLPDPSPFLERVFAAVRRDGIDASALVADHLCYRVETDDSYARWKDFLSKNGELLGEHMIAGRPIATFKLSDPFVFNDRRIDVIELPAPKTISPHPEGWEHVEFVVGEDPKDFASRYPMLGWDLSGANKTNNPDVRLSYDGFSVKFHERSLAEVIMGEKGAT